MNHEPRTSLVSRPLDFWLLGGLSVAAWCVLRLSELFLSPAAPAVPAEFARTYVAHLAGVGALGTLFLNYPHFMASYRLAYSPGLPHLRRHWIALGVVPVALLSALAVVWTFWNAGPGALAPLASVFTALGLPVPFNEGLPIGAATMTALVNLMFLATGWHYGKQTYGACLVYARYDDYTIDETQKTLLRWTIHGVWLSKWVQSHAHGALPFEHVGVVYDGVGAPPLLVTAAVLLTGTMILGVVVFIGFTNHRKTGGLPSVNAVIPFVAFLLWWYPPLVNETFTVILVPLFHALQYLPFVVRAESASVAGLDERSAHAKWTITAFGLLIAGALAFELVPRSLDAWTRSPFVTPAISFVAASSIFLNLHHYCIDAAIWRMRDSRVREIVFYRKAA